MPSLTLRDIPEDLYRRLKERAATRHRSMNGEVLTILERALASGRLPAEPILERARELQEGAELPPLDDDFLRSARGRGRP